MTNCMTRWLATFAIVLAVSMTSALGAEPTAAAGFRLQAVSDQSLGLWEGDKPVLVYNHGFIGKPEATGGRKRACYFHPVYGLDGEVLTDDFPKDHLYHRGMYWAWPHIKIGEQEYDLWSVKPELRQQFVRWVAQEANPSSAKLAVENGWFAGEKQLVREQVQIEVHAANDAGRAMDITLTWTPIDQPMTLWGAEGKSYGGFNFRFGPRTKTVITVPESAKLPEGVTASAGRISGDLLVTRLPWVDFAGNLPGSEGLSGAAIFVHPRHPDFPPTWMARHYGLVSVGWPGVESRTFPAGSSITNRYRVWVHRREVSSVDIQNEYEVYTSQAIGDKN